MREGNMAGSDILSRIQILLDADTANFSEGMQKAKGESKSTFDSIRENANSMGKVVAASATATVAALTSMAIETANQAVELEKFALRANSTTQDFQKMAVGAAAYGVEQEKLSDMMKDFNEKMGELTAIGAGGGIDFFEKIAVKTEGSAEAARELILEMQRLSGPEALQMYVDKLEEAGVSQQQMSFYLESMASDMTDLIPLLVNGGEGMDLYADAAERAGLIMSDNTIEQAAILKEQIYLLDLQMQGAKNQLMQAVIPAFVDIAHAFFGSSDQGLQFTTVAEGVAKVLKGVASIAIGAVTAIQLVGKALGGMAAIGGAIWNEMDWYEMNPIGLVKAAYEARAEISALTTEMKADMHNTVIGAAERLDTMWSGTSSGTAAQLANLRSVNTAVGGVNSGLGELVAKQNEAAGATKKHSKEADKLWRDLERLHEQQARDREQIAKAYASDFQNMVWDETEELERIRKAGFSTAEQDKYLALAKKRFDAENAEYFKKINLELNQYKWTEEQKLEYSYQMDREIAENDIKLADEVREAKLRFIDQQYAYEQNKLDEAKRSRANVATAAWGGTYSDMTGQGDQYRVEQERFGRYDQSQELFDAQMALASTAAEREAIWEEHHQRMQMIEQSYQTSSMQLQLSYGQNIASSMSTMFGAILGEQSAAYQVMFNIEKGFAVAQAGLALGQNIAQASKVGFPQNIPLIAGAFAQGAQIAQIIGSVVAPQGYAEGGLIRGPGTGTSDSIPIMASNEEFMIKAKSVESVGASTLDYINRTGELPSGKPVNQTTSNSTSHQTTHQWNVNALDGRSVERLVLDAIRNNKSEVGRTLQ